MKAKLCVASVLSLAATFEANFFSIQKAMLGTGASQRSTWSVLQGHGGKALRGTRFPSLAAAFETNFFYVQKAMLGTGAPRHRGKALQGKRFTGTPNGLFPEPGSCILNKHLSRFPHKQANANPSKPRNPFPYAELAIFFFQHS